MLIMPKKSLYYIWCVPWENVPFWHVCPTKTQTSLRIRAVWSESSLSAWTTFASLAIQYAFSEDSDQTARMLRLIWIFAVRTCFFLMSRRTCSWKTFIACVYLMRLDTRGKFPYFWVDYLQSSHSIQTPKELSTWLSSTNVNKARIRQKSR